MSAAKRSSTGLDSYFPRFTVQNALSEALYYHSPSRYILAVLGSASGPDVEYCLNNIFYGGLVPADVYSRNHMFPTRHPPSSLVSNQRYSVSGFITFNRYSSPTIVMSVTAFNSAESSDLDQVHTSSTVYNWSTFKPKSGSTAALGNRRKTNTQR